MSNTHIHAQPTSAAATTRTGTAAGTGVAPAQVVESFASLFDALAAMEDELLESLASHSQGGGLEIFSPKSAAGSVKDQQPQSLSGLQPAGAHPAGGPGFLGQTPLSEAYAASPRGGFLHCLELIASHHTHLDHAALLALADLCEPMQFKKGQQVIVTVTTTTAAGATAGGGRGGGGERGGVAEGSVIHKRRGLFFLEEGFILCMRKMPHDLHDVNSNSHLEREQEGKLVLSPESTLLQYQSNSGQSTSSRRANLLPSLASRTAAGAAAAEEVPGKEGPTCSGWNPIAALVSKLMAPAGDSFHDDLSRLQLRHLAEEALYEPTTQHGPGWVFGQLSLGEHTHTHSHTYQKQQQQKQQQQQQQQQQQEQLHFPHHDQRPDVSALSRQSSHDLLLEGRYYFAETDIKVCIVNTRSAWCRCIIFANIIIYLLL